MPYSTMFVGALARGLFLLLFVKYIIAARQISVTGTAAAAAAVAAAVA